MPVSRRSLIGAGAGVGLVGVVLVLVWLVRPEPELHEFGSAVREEVAAIEAGLAEELAAIEAERAAHRAEVLAQLRAWSADERDVWWRETARLPLEHRLRRHLIVPEEERAELIGADHAGLLEGLRMQIRIEEETGRELENERASLRAERLEAAEQAELERQAQCVRYDLTGAPPIPSIIEDLEPHHVVLCDACQELVRRTVERAAMLDDYEDRAYGERIPPFTTTDFTEACEQTNLPNELCPNCRLYLVERGLADELRPFFPEDF